MGIASYGNIPMVLALYILALFCNVVTMTKFYW